MAATQEDLEIEKAVKEFKQLCSLYTRCTDNIRTFSGDWGSGLMKVPVKLRNEVGRIVSFLQDKVNNRLFCAKDQCLMIYNFQVLSFDSTYYVLEMFKVSKDECDKLTKLKDGNGLQLLIDEKGNIVNNSYALDMMELLDEDEALKDPPVCYGNFYDYRAPVEGVPIKGLGVPPKGVALTLAFNTVMQNASKGFDLPSPVTPPSPLQFPMESPLSSFSMASFLDCRA